MSNHAGKVGYHGQKYKVLARTDETAPFTIFGWTDLSDGGGLIRMIELHPSWCEPMVQEVKDRTTGDAS